MYLRQAHTCVEHPNKAITSLSALSSIQAPPPDFTQNVSRRIERSQSCSSSLPIQDWSQFVKLHTPSLSRLTSTLMFMDPSGISASNTHVQTPDPLTQDIVLLHNVP